MRCTLTAVRYQLLGVLLAFVCVAAGCRQPDGPLPVETPDDPNRLTDVTRDLLNVAGGDANGPQELADDMRVWAPNAPAAHAACDTLARQLSAAVKGKTLDEQSAGQLARQLWIASAGRELSSRQVDRLQDEVKTLLTSAGVAEDAAATVTAQIDVLQETVTAKQRRWYQLF